MHSSRQSFKALQFAKPIKRDIDETLIKLQMEKRKLLKLEREENNLKEEVKTKRSALNQLKTTEPQIRTNSSRASQTQIATNNASRSNHLLINSIQELKASINVKRRQVEKYKRLNNNLNNQQDRVHTKNQGFRKSIADLEQDNEDTKGEILNCRESTMKNTSQFKGSHTALAKSSLQQEDQRRKFAVTQKSFLGEEAKHSKIVPHDLISEALKQSGIMHNQGKVDIMTQSVPLAKARVNSMLYTNKEKLRISENYRKFGEALDKMFSIMKQYKGRDDIMFIAKDFVTKEKQSKKLEEYISKLENTITSHERELERRKLEEEELLEEVESYRENEVDLKYEKRNQELEKIIQKMREEEKERTKWIELVDTALAPVTSTSLTRKNASEILGGIEEMMYAEGIVKNPKQTVKVERMDQNGSEKKGVTHKQVIPAPQYDAAQQGKQPYMELLDHDKLRQFANEYIRQKKNP